MGELHLFLKALQMRLSENSETWNSTKSTCHHLTKLLWLQITLSTCDFAGFLPSFSARQISPLEPGRRLIRAIVRYAAVHSDLFAGWDVLPCVHACTHACGWQECAGCSNWEIRSQREAQVSTDAEGCDETERSDLQPFCFISSRCICSLGPNVKLL